LVLLLLAGPSPARAQGQPAAGGSKAAEAGEGAADTGRKRGQAKRKKRAGRRSKARSSRSKRKAARKRDKRTEASDRSQRGVRGRVGGADSEVEAVADRVSGEGAEAGPAVGSGMRHSRHMEFDARLVRGETAGSGAVILFDRGARDLPRLTRRRREFLNATVEPVLGKRRQDGPDDDKEKNTGSERKPPRSAASDGSGK
jgi:hypothetical protein